jgi:hypothetical protein
MGIDSPNNVSNVVDVVPVVAGVHSCDISLLRFEVHRPGGTQQGLGGRNQPRKKDPSRQGGDLGIGQNGTFSQDGQKSYDVELERVDCGGRTQEMHFGKHGIDRKLLEMDRHPIPNARVGKMDSAGPNDGIKTWGLSYQVPKRRCVLILVAKEVERGWRGCAGRRESI